MNPIHIYMSRAVDYAYNGVILNFFKTGVFNFKMLGAKSFVYENKLATSSNDFIGLNYYSHYHVRVKFGSPFWKFDHLPRELMTDMSYPLYPEGLYRAIMRLSELKVPIYVTENGLADGEDTRRHLFLRRYLYALSKAIKDGAPVKGYFYWSFLDNYEWSEGYAMKFGLYSVDFDTQKRTLRDGSKYYRDIITKHKKKD